MNLRSEHILAVVWDKERLLYVLASPKGKTLRVSAARELILAPDESSAADAGQLLRVQLDQLGVRRATTLVGLARSQVEMFDLKLPPATDAELPSIVRNEVQRLTADVADSGLIDFVAEPCDSTRTDTPRTVTAAMLENDLLNDIRQLCNEANQTLSHIVLRPYAIASLFARNSDLPTDHFVLLNLLENGADISVFSHGSLTLSRSVRLTAGADPIQRLNQLADELQRSIAIAPGATSQQQIERIYLFGDEEVESAAVEQLRHSLDLPVEVIDPFQDVTILDKSVAPEALRRSCRQFAALIGILRDEVDQQHAIDFLQPKKPPKESSWRQRLVVYGSLASLLLLSLIWIANRDIKKLRSDNDGLALKLQNMEKVLVATQRKAAIVAEVERWQADGVNWLDELRDFSDRFPPARDAKVQHMSLSSDNSGLGIVNLQVRVRDPSVVATIENNLRDEFHRVQSKRVSQLNSQEAYPWQFETAMSLRPRTKEQYLERLVVNATTDTKAANETDGSHGTASDSPDGSQQR